MTDAQTSAPPVPPATSNPADPIDDLYVSWDDYHRNVEQLALAIHQSGWQFNQIVCLA